MASNGKCYNNPAFCSQFDTSLYDYEYVAEIDPDSPEVDRRQIPKTKLVYNKQQPFNIQQYYNSSDEFEDSSDNSNRSIVVEECNNRRITMICEKRNKEQVGGVCSLSGAYYQPISLESEEPCHDNNFNNTESESYRITKRRLDSPVESVDENVNKHSDRNEDRYQERARMPVQHRYEDIQCDEYDLEQEQSAFQRVHRYAEISIDHNGYPKLENEVHIIPEYAQDNHYKQSDVPRTGSSYRRTLSPKPVHPYPESHPSRPTSPVVIEMSDFSPPRRDPLDPFRVTSPSKKPIKRHPPIGASSPTISAECVSKNKNPISRNISKITSKISGHVKPNTNSPKKKTNRKDHGQNIQQRSQTARSCPKIPRVKMSEPTENSPLKHPIRRNLFINMEHPRQNQYRYGRSPNPYQPTTQGLRKTTAIVTPIFQRRKYDDANEVDSNKVGINRNGKSNFEITSSRFQSTGRIIENPMNDPGIDDDTTLWETEKPRCKIKRNQSVPNFRQLSPNRNLGKSTLDLKQGYNHSTPKKTLSPRKTIDFPSPSQSYYQTSPINKSRLSLIDQMKTSWSSLSPDFHAPPVGCLTIMALVLVASGIASCVIGFYLISKLGRRYYLDLGILASFINMVLGVLGFRAHCWKWLPNRNYVSGYIFLAIFSILTCAGLASIVIARPMAGEPLFDIASGAIGGVSVLTIILSITGLTMSSCCKSPPPDNRVSNL